MLIVDDNALLLMLLSQTLQGAGYEVGVASDGDEGLQKFRNGSWDAVVTDCEMPKMNGEQMAAEIKRLSPQTPVILGTGGLSKVKNPDLFDEIFTKPYKGAEIRDALAALLDAGNIETPAEVEGLEHNAATDLKHRSAAGGGRWQANQEME